MWHFIWVYTVRYDNTIFIERNVLYLEIDLWPLNIYTMDHPKFITSNQKEEYIRA